MGGAGTSGGALRRGIGQALGGVMEKKGRWHLLLLGEHDAVDAPGEAIEEARELVKAGASLLRQRKLAADHS